MFTQTRFLTGGLATLAIASAVTLASPASAAEVADRPCGQPAVPAVYVTVVVDAPEIHVIPAVTHQEWRWERTVTTFEHEFTKVLAAAYDETDWTRDLPAEYRWTRTVVTQEAVPAVPGTPEVSHLETIVVTPAVTVTLFEYVQKEHPEMTRWEEDGWNGEQSDGDHGRGWTKTGNTREKVLTPAVTTQVKVVDEPATPGTPAVPAVSHVEDTWSTTSPGADWSKDLATPPHGGGTETVTTSGDQPAGSGWTIAAVRHVAAVVDTQWALDAPAGYSPTGASRVHDVTTEQTDTTSPTPPAGDGWTKIADSLVVVVDEPETTELVGTGTTREVLVSPELPATPACPAAAAGDTSAPVGTTSGPKAAEGSSAVAGAHASHTGTHVAAGVAAVAAPGATVLPATGNPASPLLLATGLGAVIAGGVLVRAGRRRPTR